MVALEIDGQQASSSFGLQSATVVVVVLVSKCSQVGSGSLVYDKNGFKRNKMKKKKK